MKHPEYWTCDCCGKKSEKPFQSSISLFWGDDVRQDTVSEKPDAAGKVYPDVCASCIKKAFGSIESIRTVGVRA